MHVIENGPTRQALELEPGDIGPVRLTRFSDYALRALLLLGARDGSVVSVAEIARRYGISYHHLVKVAGMLVDLEVVEAVRGRRGGLRLSRAPSDINVGWVVRRTEPDFHLVECFDAATDTCPITPACALKHVLMDAQQSFLATLDRHTLADLLAKPEKRLELVQLWSGSRSGRMETETVG
jgi:Rrf2 family nitric oxide-sensitive transcriptional repressor